MILQYVTQHASRNQEWRRNQPDLAKPTGGRTAAIVWHSKYAGQYRIILCSQRHQKHVLLSLRTQEELRVAQQQTPCHGGALLNCCSSAGAGCVHCNENLQSSMEP
jgi:hypothetical protein